MTDPRELQPSDIVSIDAEPLSDLTFRVSDTDVTNIGIAETIAVTLVSDADDAPNYALVGTTADSTFTLEECEPSGSEGSLNDSSETNREVGGDDEVTVTTNAIVLE